MQAGKPLTHFQVSHHTLQYSHSYVTSVTIQAMSMLRKALVASFMSTSTGGSKVPEMKSTESRSGQSFEEAP